jgi:ABC-2 type transport system permease protein
MKVLDIALKDMLRSMRSMSAWIFMIVVPILTTSLFYFAFGSFAERGEFSLPRVSVVIANLDKGGPNLHLRGRNVPGEIEARTLGELVVKILQSDELSELVDVSITGDENTARSTVDTQKAQVALIIPPDFSERFADPNEQAMIKLYQDPTLAIGPAIIRSILSQFMDGLAGINIAADIAIDQADVIGNDMVGQVVQQYLVSYMMQDDDLAASMLNIKSPRPKSESNDNPVLAIVGPIMGGMMIFYSFYTGTASAQSILKEEEEQTLPRLFTTPTSQATILGGKYLAVFLTVLVQIITLLVLSRLVFLIQWGHLASIAIVAMGVVCCATSFGVFINSLLKNTKQSGLVFGGVIALTGMIGMIKIFTMGIPGGSQESGAISLLVPQGWAVQGLLQSMDMLPASAVLGSALGMAAWSLILFMIGLWRFNRRYR